MQFGTAELRRGAFGQPSVPFLLSRRAHLLTTPKGRWYCLWHPCALRGGCGSISGLRAAAMRRLASETPRCGSACGSLMSNATALRICCHCPRRRLYVLLHHQNSCFQNRTNSPPASEKHQPDVFHCYGYRISCDTHFLFEKKKQKQERKDGEDEWRSTTWKQRWSAEVQGVLLWLLPHI